MWGAVCSQAHHLIFGHVQSHVVMRCFRLDCRENSLFSPLGEDEGNVVHVGGELESHGEEKDQNGIDE